MTSLNSFTLPSFNHGYGYVHHQFYKEFIAKHDPIKWTDEIPQSVVDHKESLYSCKCGFKSPSFVDNGNIPDHVMEHLQLHAKHKMTYGAVACSVAPKSTSLAEMPSFYDKYMGKAKYMEQITNSDAHFGDYVGSWTKYLKSIQEKNTKQVEENVDYGVES